ncbi:MAG: YfiR family protein [Rhizobacter sp.]|nr:YfiR family protein [Rhizobacter sp.]
MSVIARRWTRLLALLAALGAAPAWAVDPQELKAAIVFNLLLFVEWPADAVAGSTVSLVLCVSPSNALNAPLKALQGRPVRSQLLDVRELPAGASRAVCHAVYLDAADTARQAGAKLELAAMALVISDDVESPSPQSAIVLRHVGGRMGFDVNLEAARQARLQFSSKLLRLARRVNDR